MQVFRSLLVIEKSPIGKFKMDWHPVKIFTVGLVFTLFWKVFGSLGNIWQLNVLNINESKFFVLNDF